MFYFCKMQATGNDFVLVDYTSEKVEYSFKLLAEYLCNRHYGVGADGLIIIDKSVVADLKMRIFNPDGSEAEMCGNGIRCFAKYVYEHEILRKEKFQVETMSGIKEIELKVEGKKVLSVKVEIGKPIFELKKIPVIYEVEKNLEKDMNRDYGKDNTQKLKCREDSLKNSNEYVKKGINIGERIFYPVSLGNPHVVCFVDNLEETDVRDIGNKVENYKYFPNKTNVEFVQVVREDNIKVKVWERGVGETLSCGTGACAAVIISHIVKSTNCEMIVDLTGGILNVSYDKDNKKVYLEGEVQEVFIGNMRI